MYPIKKEFGIFRKFTPPINKPFLLLASKFMKTPSFIYKDQNLDVKKHTIPSYDNANIDVIVMSPKTTTHSSPCLIYCHGGGFVLEAASYHYELCMKYAKEVNCKVVFINYRIAPKYQHPTYFEDCYAAFLWTYNHASELGIDTNKIGLGGDSAGSTLAVGICRMAIERNHPIQFRFQMLPYPYLDARNNSESAKKYTDTPMWNSRLSKKIENMTNADRNHPNFIYNSPIEAQNFKSFPPAYIETAEFDCLYDDGILYAKRLKEEGIFVELNETKGTMHGYDIVLNASTTKDSIKKRIAFMKKNV